MRLLLRALIAESMVGALVLCATIAVMSCEEAPQVDRNGSPEPVPAISGQYVESLAALGRLWATVRFFHPYLYYRDDIDWDAALVETIPLIEAARTADEYQSAIDHMLSFLGDPITRTISDDEANGAAPGPRVDDATQPRLERTADDIAIVSDIDPRAFYSPDAVAAFSDLVGEASDARAVVFDLRASVVPRSLQAENRADLSQAFASALPLLLQADVRLADRRHVTHSGFAPHGGRASTYKTTFSRRQGNIYRGVGTEDVPIVFVTSEETSGLQDQMLALRDSRKAWIVLEGDPSLVRDENVDTLRVALPHGVTARVRTSERASWGVPIKFVPDVAVEESNDDEAAITAALDLIRGAREPDPMATQAKSLVAQPIRDDSYKHMSYPPLEYRLLGLFRAWSTIHYFYPYHRLLDEPWDGVLTEYIPRFSAASDGLEYALVVADLVTRIQDTHAQAYSDVLAAHMGTHAPPIVLKWVEEKTVIAAIMDADVEPESGLQVGDVVLKVDDEPVADRLARLRLLVSHSTPQALDWSTHWRLLAGPEGTSALIEVESEGGRRHSVSVERGNDYQIPTRETPTYGVVADGIGYMDLARLTVDDIDAAFDEIANTAAVIFDIRGYPNNTAWRIGSRLAETKVVAAQFWRNELGETGPGSIDTLEFEQYTEPDEDRPRYAGRVVALINENAISHAEHTCLVIEAAAEDITFIGTPTNGANGDVTVFVLPGGFSVSFTGQGVRHADGRQLQRVGIQPDIRVAPTIAGMRAGRDEVLERAIDHLVKMDGN